MTMNIYAQTETWNSAGGLDHYKVDITDTLSGADSFFFRVQLGSADVYRVRKTGAVETSSGSAASPAYSFKDDTNTGVYRAGSNEIGFSASGNGIAFVGTASFRTTVPVRASDGDASVPAFSFSSDTDTGFFRSSSNSIGIARGGSLSYLLGPFFAAYGSFVDASNNERLEFGHDASVAYLNSASIGSGMTRDIELQIDGTAVATFGASGKVVLTGLPTSDPANAGQLWNDSDTLKVSAG